MAFKPNEITRDHILAAVTKIESEKLELKRSNRWDVIINGKHYPPKEIMRFAHEQMNSEKIWEYGGGEATNKFLSKFGFELHDKRSNDDPLQAMIDNYKKNIHQFDDESYKWELLGKFQGHPDLTAPELFQEFKSINFANLIYPMGIAVIHDLAKKNAEKYRESLTFLFDEQVSLDERILNLPEKVERIYKEIVSDEKLGHFHDERTMATLLTFHNPDKYVLFKDSFYKKFCKLLDEKPRKKGEKYPHYLTLVQDFISDYILNDQELIKMALTKIPTGGYSDPNYTLLAQDILYLNLDRNLGGSERRYWRIGTSEGDRSSSYWEVMKAESHVSIGWKDLGDLREKNIKSKKDVESILKKFQPYADDNRLASRKSGEIYNFLDEIKIGDVILAQEGSTILGIGIVEDEYEFDNNKAFPHIRSVNWKLFAPSLTNDVGNRTTVYEISEQAITRKVDELLMNGSDQMLDPRINKGLTMDMPLNQIIYGPPGTGKTHKLITEYFPMFSAKDEIFNEDNCHKNLVEKYTWWQIVAAAVFDLKKANVTQILEHRFVQEKISVSNQKSPRAMLWSMLQQHTKNDCKQVNYSLRNEPLFFNKDASGVWTIDETIIDNDAPEIKEFIKLWSNPQQLRINEPIKYYSFVTFHQSFCYEDFIEGIKPVMEGENDVGNIGYTIEDGVFKKICDRARKDPENKYALFIDEINRGNVSQIFGELITLIEKDKREWEPQNIPIKLAYSKKEFSVPPNLYIIGTMNTADRSIEALDTALRRRFSFEELLPVPELIKTHGKLRDKNGILDGIDLAEVLSVMNKRIEKLKDKDHMIGHSYFLNVETMADLKMSFQRCIIPLLQEYFFGDYGKIGLVIGADFFENEGTQAQEDENLFADFNEYDSSDFSSKPIYKLLNVNNLTDAQAKTALMKLLKRG